MIFIFKNHFFIHAFNCYTFSGKFLPHMNTLLIRSADMPIEVDVSGTSINLLTLPNKDCPMAEDEEPRDLTFKRKLRQVPPPLDLSKRTLDLNHSNHNNLFCPKSPSLQKNLPLRKRYQVLRTVSWSSQPNLTLQTNPDDKSREVSSISELNNNNNSNILCNVSARSASSLKITGLPTPYTPHTPQTPLHPYSAIPVTTSRFNFTENGGEVLSNSSCYGVSTNIDQGPLNLSTTSVGAIPSSLLSPAPSHPSSSSLNSSREELEAETMSSESIRLVSPLPSNLPPHAMHLISNNNKHDHCTTAMDYSCESAVVSPGHQWPTTVWSIFLAGVQVHFMLGGGKITGAQMSEELGQWTCHQHYAPHGLHLLKANFESHSTYGCVTTAHAPVCQLYFRPVRVQHQDIMVIAPIDHPFYVHGKGWCSLATDHATRRYSVPCEQLIEGDICLPPNHPETTYTPASVATPDLTDAMKRFDFSDDHNDIQSHQNIRSAPPSATLSAPHLDRSVFLSPPASPSKKTKCGMGNESSLNSLHSIGENSHDHSISTVKSRRPMNGFMLFAKHHRLKLIQQHPGKDNRAISVILGAMWKTLPEDERDRFTKEAKIQAEERKRLDPDCWKRKRSHSTS